MGLKENLRRKRLAHQMTLEQVGKAIGVSRQTILRYETGVIANPPAEKIEGLAALYHTTPARLMGWEGRPAVRAAFYGGGRQDEDRAQDLELLAALGEADAAEQSLLALWDRMDEEQRRSLMRYARFLASGEAEHDDQRRTLCAL